MIWSALFCIQRNALRFVWVAADFGTSACNISSWSYQIQHQIHRLVKNYSDSTLKSPWITFLHSLNILAASETPSLQTHAHCSVLTVDRWLHILAQNVWRAWWFLIVCCLFFMMSCPVVQHMRHSSLFCTDLPAVAPHYTSVLRSMNTLCSCWPN